MTKTDWNQLLNPDSDLEQSLQDLIPAKVANAPFGPDNMKDDAALRDEFGSFVETMKTKENVQKIMAQLNRLAPALYEALVSERDAYMAAGLNGLNQIESIVAVMGIAHVNGVEENLRLNGWQEQKKPSSCRL